MELNINVSKITVAIDATPALLAAISALTGSHSNPDNKEVRTAVASPTDSFNAMSDAMEHAAKASAPAPQPEQSKKDEISDADMRKVIGPAVKSHGQQAIIDILNSFGITSNRTTDVPQDKRAEFLDKIKALG